MELNPARAVAIADMIDYLRSRGHGPLLEVLADPSTMTKARDGRQTRVKVARVASMMGLSPEEVTEMLDRLRHDVEQQGGR